jgi:hypothetical protein
MGVIGKIFAIVMLPLGVLMILEQFNIFSFSLPIDKVFLGAALMTLLQIITLIMVMVHQGKIMIMNIITAIVFIGTAGAAVFFKLTGGLRQEFVLILAVIMCVEALYALH